MTASVGQTRTARTRPIGALGCSEYGRPKAPERLEILDAEPLDQVLSVGRLGAVRPLGPRPATKIVIHELVMEEDKQALQEPIEASSARHVGNVDAGEPETEFSISIEVTIKLRLPSSSAVEYAGWSRRIIAVEDHFYLDRLEAASPYIDVDLSLGDRARAVHKNDMPNVRENIREDQPVLLEAQSTLLTQRRA